MIDVIDVLYATYKAGVLDAFKSMEVRVNKLGELGQANPTPEELAALNSLGVEAACRLTIDVVRKRLARDLDKMTEECITARLSDAQREKLQSLMDK